MFDILITGGRVIDGTGSPWFRADVGIAGGHIASIGRLAHAQARERLDVAGKVVDATDRHVGEVKDTPGSPEGGRGSADGHGRHQGSRHPGPTDADRQRRRVRHELIG